MRHPPAGLQIQDKGVTAEGASARAVRAGPPMKAMYVFGMLIVIALAGTMITSIQAPKGPVGDQGPTGPKGPQADAGPPGTASGIRIVRSNLDYTTCAVDCRDNEIMFTASCDTNRKS